MQRRPLGLGLLLMMSAPAALSPAATQVIENESFSFPLPDGYRDVTHDPRLKDFRLKQVSVQAIGVTKGLQPAIIFVLAPVWGGALGNPEFCRVSAANMARDRNGKVKSWSLIPGPRASVCQTHLISGEGVASLITELTSFTETWAMMCDHADGDLKAEEICRATLAGFRFKEREAPAKIELPLLGVRECDDYLNKARACIWSRFSKKQVSALGFVLKLDAEGLKKTAATEEGRKSLPEACNKMSATAKKTWAAAAACAW